MMPITNDPSTLMRQASTTAETYMKEAITAIDQAFGTGYAKEHPSLVGDFMRAAATDFGAAVLANVTQQLGESLATGLGRIADR